MVSFPHCKINLGLNVVSKRTDGYHNIVTCFYPVPWNDILEIIPSDKLVFQTSGNIIPGNETDNLCLKAYHLLRADFDIAPVHMHLHKNIPTGAGLGGGSADGAFALRSLNTIFNLGLTNEKLRAYASKLGSDCAFFIEDKPMIGTDRGEVLADISVSLKGKFLAIIKPDIHISTAEAYANIKPASPAIGIQEVLEEYSIDDWQNFLKNDFEDSVFAKAPAINALKEQLYGMGAIYASMTGSGSAVFAIFNERRTIQFPSTVCWSGDLP